MQYADYTLWQRGLLGEEDDPGSLLAQSARLLARSPGRGTRGAESARRPPAAAGGQLSRGDRAGPPRCRRCTGGCSSWREPAGRACSWSCRRAWPRCCRGWGPARTSRSAARSRAAASRRWKTWSGFFVNTLVLRTDVSGDPSFRELVERVRAFDLEAYEHQDLPFERLVEALQPARSLARHPLFQVMLVLQNTPEAELSLPGLAVQPEPLHANVAKFDLTLGLVERLGPRRRAAGDRRGTGVQSGPVRAGDGRSDRRRGWCGCWKRRWRSPDVPLHRLEILDAERAAHPAGRVQRHGASGARGDAAGAVRGPGRRAPPRPWRWSSATSR